MSGIKKGFTLAEVLITFGIIGVIFLLTLSGTILHLTKKDVPAKLKKVQSVFSQLTNSLIVENGPVATWDWEGAQSINAARNIMENMLKPKLSFTRYCGLDINKGCGTSFKYLNNSPAGDSDTLPYATKGILNDGMSIVFETEKLCSLSITEPCGTVMVDINGPGGPNKAGKDIFYFAFYSNNNFLPLGYYENREDIEDNCSKDSDGKYCAAKIALDGWEIREELPFAYPW